LEVLYALFYGVGTIGIGKIFLLSRNGNDGKITGEMTRHGGVFFMPALLRLVALGRSMSIKSQ
jgi:hypothetical protein